MGQCYYFCHYRWTNGPPPDTPKTEEEALSRIDDLYASGVPFFSKDTIRSAWEQMQKPLADGDKIYIKALDGEMIEYDLRIGHVRTMREVDGPDTEWVLEAPSFRYECRAHLRQSIFRRGFDNTHPLLCPVSITHSCLVRYKDTHVPTGTPHLSQQRVSEDFQRYRAAWLQTEMCARLNQILEKSAGHLEVRKVVAVSLGSLGWDLGEEDERSGRQAYQHAMTISLRDWARQKDGQGKGELPCYVQDPDYDDSDKAVLRGYGVDVIDDPVAWLEMDEFSIVVSIASNVPSREITADVCRPAVVVWNRVSDEDYDQRGGDSLTDPCSPRVRAMMEGYDCHDFGASVEHFGDVLVYVRRPKTLCRE